VATSLHNLALVYDNQGKYAEAEPLYKRALVIAEKALGPEHPHVAQSLNNLGGLFATQGKYAEAEPLFKRARAINEKALGPEHPSVARNLNGLASLYQAQGKYNEAAPLYKRALVIYEKALGPEHPHVVTTLENYTAMMKMNEWNAKAAKLETLAKAIRVRQERQKPWITIGFAAVAILLVATFIYGIYKHVKEKGRAI